MDLYWSIFEKSGSVEAYLAHKYLTYNKEKSVRNKTDREKQSDGATQI